MILVGSRGAEAVRVWLVAAVFDRPRPGGMTQTRPLVDGGRPGDQNGYAKGALPALRDLLPGFRWSLPKPDLYHLLL